MDSNCPSRNQQKSAQHIHHMSKVSVANLSDLYCDGQKRSSVISSLCAGRMFDMDIDYKMKIFTTLQQWD
jgi:hypothetical protein